MKVERHHQQMLSVWFFIGLLLTIYGVIILTIGIRDYHKVSTTVLLAQYHAPFWGGLLLLSLGVTYLYFNWPTRTRK